VLDADKISGWYTFNSEGALSTRQAIFKIKNGELVEGYGDITQRGDTAYFKYPSALSYEENHPFKRIVCDQVQL
jgi:hypothetical protein